MEELTTIEIFTRRILYLVGWLINQLRYIFLFGSNDGNNIKSFSSPLIWLTFGLLIAFGALHIFKRFLRKD